ncbi:hypothetical protein MXB_989 [Myxobolus squamalis]|nr:hypothetical protein MXB_989 [Myxobolus squamalis]
MQLIAEQIITIKYDVVVLLEVFYQESINIIKKIISKSLPYHHYFISGCIGSGIFIFSKYQIKEPSFTPYCSSGSPFDRTGDYYSCKGIAYCKIRISNGEIKLIATHMHASYLHDNFYLLRLKQSYELSKFVQMISDENIPIILAGDLNIEAHDIGMKYLLSQAKLIDSCETIHQESVVE